VMHSLVFEVGTFSISTITLLIIGILSYAFSESFVQKLVGYLVEEVENFFDVVRSISTTQVWYHFT
jgi:hypothetical protein